MNNIRSYNVTQTEDSIPHLRISLTAQTIGNTTSQAPIENQTKAPEEMASLDSLCSYL